MNTKLPAELGTLMSSKLLSEIGTSVANSVLERPYRARMVDFRNITIFLSVPRRNHPSEIDRISNEITIVNIANSAIDGKRFLAYRQTDQPFVPPSFQGGESREPNSHRLFPSTHVAQQCQLV